MRGTPGQDLGQGRGLDQGLTTICEDEAAESATRGRTSQMVLWVTILRHIFDLLVAEQSCLLFSVFLFCVDFSLRFSFLSCCFCAVFGTMGNLFVLECFWMVLVERGKKQSHSGSEAGGLDILVGVARNVMFGQHLCSVLF